MKYELRRIDIWPIVKIVFILSLLLGFFVGLLYAGMFLLLDAFANLAADSGFAELDSLGSAFAIIVILACTAGISFINTVGAIILVVLYNLTAGSIGGLYFDLQPVEGSIVEKDSAG
ncbi:DUF3566 domain-containing protein [candidate division KSB1 bacterium]|nr:DUF3566 domain-containing protein [candidate division KSB1 bacterium]